MGGHNNHDDLHGVYTNMRGAFELVFSMLDKQSDVTVEKTCIDCMVFITFNYSREIRNGRNLGSTT